MTKRTLVDYAMQLTPQQWHRLTISMSWYYKSHEMIDPPPDIVRRLGHIPSKDSWSKLRQEIKRLRQAHAKERLEQLAREKAAAKREYARNYMREYRAKARGGFDGNST